MYLSNMFVLPTSQNPLYGYFNDEDPDIVSQKKNPSLGSL